MKLLVGAGIVVSLFVSLVWFQEVTSLINLPTVSPFSFASSRPQHSTYCNERSLMINDSFNLFHGRNQATTRLYVSVLPLLTKAVSSASPSVRSAVLLGAAVLTLVKRQQILYPGTSPDPKFSEPLPPGSFGCPFLGHNIFKSTNENGVGEFFKYSSAKLGNARMFKYMFIGKPVVAVTGVQNVKQVLSHEFNSIHMMEPVAGQKRIFGKESLLMSTQNDKHSFQRRLVGAAMMPNAIEKATPFLQKSVAGQIDHLLQLPTVVMEEICKSFTVDVAWRQILGLHLNDSEIPLFYRAVNDWSSGIFKLQTVLLPGIQFTKHGRSYAFLINLINKKIDELNRDGPDGSTLSAMLFARDELDGRKLSRQQVIDNVMLLIFAGSETTASTLTTGILLLGLHPDVFQKMKEEQRHLAAKDKGVLSLRQIDKECPYLDAVIKEILRINPVAAGIQPRSVEETIILDGIQIPKGYGVTYNVHLTHAYDPVTRKPDGSHMDVIKGFKPERWLSNSTIPSEFMPFGYGSRYCLGANLALAEMKVFLSLFTRRVDFDLVNMSRDHITWQKTGFLISKPEDGCVIAPRRSFWKEDEAHSLAKALA